ncbi:YkgJ family cysteine cluster protein [Dehalogenimonas formicexedens]|nr:YkgJ family cysteine cluster protein [Dehalogenimonas formicexedens]
MTMAWKMARLKPEALEEPMLLTGGCNRCYQCCICWIYELPDGSAAEAPRKGWCPHLDLEKRACRIWGDRPEGCWRFPTLRDFELGCVPESCGFRLIKGGNHGTLRQP